MSLHLKGERSILVLSTNKTETQTITKHLNELKPIYCRYILAAQTHQEKVNRYIESILETYPEEFEVNYDWLDAAHGVEKPKYSRQLIDVQNYIVRWINQAQTDGYKVTWHNE